MANVVVINPYEVPKGREEEALAMWDKFAEYFRRQPGYVSTKLHRALGPDAKFPLVNVAEWESAEHFVAALQSPALKQIAAGLPVSEFPHYPALYQVIRT